MSRVAAIYDVHANLPALEAVLAAAREAGAEQLVLGGDYAWGPMPVPVLRRIRALEQSGAALIIRGNADREVAAGWGESDGLDPMTAAVNRWAADQLSEEDRRWLAHLPERHIIEVAGRGPVLFCHGSPRSDTEAVLDTTPGPRLAEMLEGVSAATVVLGHTHLQFLRTHAGTAILNPGSVGLGCGAPGAYWALIDRDDILLQRTAYDYVAAGRAFLAAGGPAASEFAEHLIAPPSAEEIRRAFA